MTAPRSLQDRPLWSDGRIGELIQSVLMDEPNHTPRGLVRRVSYIIRTGYEAERSAQSARIAGLEAAAMPALGWIDEIYPASVFDGSSGDEGPVRIVAIRENLRRALAEAQP